MVLVTAFVASAETSLMRKYTGLGDKVYWAGSLSHLWDVEMQME